MGQGDPRLPVRASAYGPLIFLSLRVHELSHTGRCHEALDAADAYLHFARLAGDEKTVTYLLQGRMYAYLILGRYHEASEAGEEVLARHRAAGFTLGEAKTLADLAELHVLSGRFVDGMRYLARAGLLLDGSNQRNDRYISALASVGEAANTAELHEVAAARYEGVMDLIVREGHRRFVTPWELAYSISLLFWGLRLDHLGRSGEAAVRLRRALDISESWLAAFPGDDTDVSLGIRATRALALAKLGRADEAAEMAAAIAVPLRRMEQHWAARFAHLALGLAERARGDLAAARREFRAAEQLCAFGARPAERLIIRYETAQLVAEINGAEANREMLELLQEQTGHLWELRLQRLAMLRQAQQREELESQRERAEREMLHDPLTGLGNRRRFDQLVAAIDAGELTGPLVLLLLDVDEFKAINDGYSHSAGDLVLAEIGRILRTQCRAEDVAVRYAGDEFTVFLRADLTAGQDIAERIRVAVRSTDFSLVPRRRVSVSTGVAALLPGMSGAELFHTADLRLYEAKRHGRDRVAA
jgi:diguanylate cyclase